MRLQPKKSIAADLATQRKTQIDEGIKIASKVDVLRETFAKEEGELKRFREETIATVQADIDRYIGERDSLKQEIKVLENQKTLAQIPLDEEWKNLRQVEQKFHSDDQVLKEKFIALNERQTEIEKSEREIKDEIQRVTGLKHRASLSLVEADSVLTNARKESTSIRNKAQITLLAAELKEKEVNIKEQEIERLKMELEKIRLRQEKKDIEQAALDKTIKDRYATLERTISRIEK